MPAIAVSTKREALMKQREKERLERLLALMFGSRYPLHWTYAHTSYFDGHACYVKYDVQTPKHREFTLAEKRVLRQWEAFHERGHEYYDFLPDYIDWVEEHSSNNFKEWEANEKYPLQWLQFFGNTAMDGRMELLVTSTFPTQKDYFEFGNYEWRFGIRGQHSGEDVIHDFKECFMHRALGMEDIEEWEVEVINLVDAIQEDIESLRIAATTQDCLDITLDIMKVVWPQLMEWLNIQEQDISIVLVPGTPVDDHNDEKMSWASKEQAEKNAERTFKKLGIKPTRHSQSKEGKEEEAEAPETDTESDCDHSEGESTQEGKDEEPEAPEAHETTEPTREEKLQQMLESVEKQLEKENKEMDSQEAPFETRKDNVEIKNKNNNISDEVTIKEYPNTDLDKYKEVKAEINGQVKPFARAIKQILEGTPDEHRRNQKKGNLRVNKVWKAKKCDDVNIYDRTLKGTPDKNAVIYTQFDNSGSTLGEIVKQMQKAAVLITEGCEQAKVPHYSYAFTEEYTDKTYTELESHVFPLKPTNQLTDRERGYIGGMSALSGNRDTLILQWTVDQIAKRPEDIKLLIMISDGEPYFKTGEDESTMRSIVLRAEKSGIDVLCLFVGNHRPQTIEKVRYMYNNHVISVENNISKEMQKQVKRIIKKRRG